MRHRHRISHDIDIFLSDVQLLGFLNPRLNDLPVRNYIETPNPVRKEHDDWDLDYNVAMQVLPYASEDEGLSIPGIDGTVPAMRDDEIVARKIHHRAAYFMARDLYDFAVIARANSDLLNTREFLGLLASNAELLRHFLQRKDLPSAFATIDTAGSERAPSFSEAAYLLEKWINVAFSTLCTRAQKIWRWLDNFRTPGAPDDESATNSSVSSTSFGPRSIHGFWVQSQGAGATRHVAGTSKAHR